MDTKSKGANRVIIESAHPYLSDTDQTWTYTLAGSPAAIDVTFDAQTLLEDGGWDILYVMDGDSVNIPGSPFTGADLAGATKTINGDTVKIRLVGPDGGYWGFGVATVVEGTSYTPVAYVAESAHPYLPNTDETKTYTLSGSPSVVHVFFDPSTRMEDGYDFIYVMDNDENNIDGSPFTGVTLAGTTQTVNGDTVKIRLTSDESVCFWGYGATVSAGLRWKEVKPAGDVDKGWTGGAMDADGSHLIVVNLLRLYTSSDGGEVWVERQPAGDVNRTWNACASDSDGSNLIVVASGGRVYTSSNGGVGWTERTPAGDANQYWDSCASDDDGSVLIVGMRYATEGVYVSSNGGASWTLCQPAGAVEFSWLDVTCNSDGSVLLAAAGAYEGSKLYKSTNGGASWTDITPAASTGLGWLTCDTNADGSVILAASYARINPIGGTPDWSYGGRLYLSTNGGTSWTETRPAGDVNKFWRALSLSGDGELLLAGGTLGSGDASPSNPGRLYSSDDSGTTWGEERPAGDVERTWWVAAADSDGSVLLVGVNGGRLYMLAPITVQSNAVWYFGI